MMGREGPFERLRCDRCDAVEEVEMGGKHGAYYPCTNNDIRNYGWQTDDEADVLVCEDCSLWVAVPISSSGITRAAYFPELETLQVEFPSGDVFAYMGVPSGVVNALQHAESAGSYFNKHIKEVYDLEQDEWND